ncbi:RB1-inducible coiled-coil protein 1 isoform X1 [Drosophila sulfurigaster albostrigata]|uniref:RB1-inducible coiled-coil protein 1 isoform X1 n=1 Tax=Drosophila sulfurigaster albostrigata TaxID=89887 RepID=UPI002D21E04F|nr:RB1-inducible coiled-coil protein 1 isoform X1 [Drosophila sulfurigaster albostrigata]XP_062124655.1 RB1-inducible coiled-coil protein 1 isoform X1 [Drosophila sulfurigaster albostrigata]
MMLYVFHVDVGRMLSFDMTVALSSVENLKETIYRLHGIPAASIVLLVSGGEMLTHSTQVSCYSAGTDTNPIYMFLTGEERLAPTIASGSSGDAADAELRRQVEESHKLSAVLETVRQRSQLAQHMRELGRKEEQLCERLVHEQHLQQQGWSAVVANMEDLTNEFADRFHNFCQAFDRHLQQRDSYLELLRNFGDDLTQLARIPILPALMALAEGDFHGFDELLDNDGELPTVAGAGESSVEKSSSSTSPNKKLKMGHDAEQEAETSEEPTQTQTQTQTRQQHQLNLLQWISSKGNHAALQQMCDECVQGLDTFSVEIYEKLKLEVQNIIKVAKKDDVKEIKGLSDRLYRLDEFKYKIQKMVQDQREQATALQQNEARALNLRDNSVLPDLCLSHRSQLQVMLDNHIKIREYCRCIANSKDELGRNLHTRLGRVVWIENGMSDFDNRLLFYLRCLRRAERHINIIEQIHRAPSTYVAAVTEVVRRKIFSDQFRRWASRLSVDFNRIHGEELQRRQLFNASFDGHFLNILFPGMADMPPTFANEHPELSFDTRLPQLSQSDIEMLSTQLPELATQLQLPDMTPVLQFFEFSQQTSEQQQVQEIEAGEEPPATKQSVSTSTCHSLQVEQMARSTATEQLLMLSASTLTEENAGSVERLRTALQSMSKLALQCLSMARSNLSSLRQEMVTHYQDELQSELQLLQDKWQVLRMQSEQRQQEQLEELQQLREQLSTAEQEKISAVAQAREQLIHEHKTELESLRCRFKLMTSMERSPSDSSLEKLERPTSSASVASLDVEQLLAQQRQDMLAQRERAISEAVEAERAVWQARQAPAAMSQLNSESVMANVSILRDMLEDKERQLDMLREQNNLLIQESYQLKTRLDVLTNEDGSSWLKEKIDYLNRDKCRLEEELNMEKSKRIEMESSVAALRSSTYELGGGTMTRSRSSGASSSHRFITLENCAKGDLVFVVWSIRHSQFMVVQDSLTLYFVHADSLAGLQLTAPAPVPAVPPTAGDAPLAVLELNQIPLPYYAIGRVIDKEYCQARKDENRYRVSKGSKFYRIKLAPLVSRNPLRRERLESSGSVAGFISRSQLTTAVRDAVDASMVSMSGTSLSGSSVYQSFKERTVSISSVNEEEDESTSLISERCRYISVSEEDELLALAAGSDSTATITSTTAAAAATTTATTTTATTITEAAATAATQAQSVITEQPTSRKLQLDLLKLDLLKLASADIIIQPLTQQQQQPERKEEQKEKLKEEDESQSETVADATTTTTTMTTNEPNPQSELADDQPDNVATTATAATSVAVVEATTTTTATISEDSDEYRSLEAKDEADFPISE